MNSNKKAAGNVECKRTQKMIIADVFWAFICLRCQPELKSPAFLWPFVETWKSHVFFFMRKVQAAAARFDIVNYNHIAQQKLCDSSGTTII